MGRDPLTAHFVDCGLTFSGPATPTLSGLNHLAGETVTVVGDGATHPDVIVSPTGTITLTRSVSTASVGLPYAARVTTLRFEAGSTEGTAQGKIKRINKLVLRVADTLGIRTGPPEGPLDEIVTRIDTQMMDSRTPLYTGDTRLIEFPGDYSTAAQVTVESFEPFPMVLLAIMPQMTTQDR